MTRGGSLILVALLVSTLFTPNGALSMEPTARKFQNCTLLREFYPGGVAMPGASNSGGATQNTPKYSKKLYKANKHLDRDKDRIACEN
jgi:hypothetical protein